jgi:hypothetical protein
MNCSSSWTLYTVVLGAVAMHVPERIENVPLVPHRQMLAARGDRSKWWFMSATWKLFTRFRNGTCYSLTDAYQVIVQSCYVIPVCTNSSRRPIAFFIQSSAFAPVPCSERTVGGWCVPLAQVSNFMIRLLSGREDGGEYTTCKGPGVMLLALSSRYDAVSLAKETNLFAPGNIVESIDGYMRALQLVGYHPWLAATKRK